MHLQLHIFRLQYSFERICTAIGNISTIQCSLYCKLGANTAHSLRFTLCELWSRTYTVHLQLHIFRPDYSTERICAAIGYNWTFRCVLYCNLGAKYSARSPVYAMSTVVPDKYNVITSPHIQASTFD
jgi:hypothetical protein